MADRLVGVLRHQTLQRQKCSPCTSVVIELIQTRMKIIWALVARLTGESRAA